MTAENFVYIVILNWNGWADTLECLESVFRLHHHHYRVIVCDNDSQDGSVEKITFWADGLLNVHVESSTKLRYLSWPFVGKPVTYQVLTNNLQYEYGNCNREDAKLTIIRTGANLGFAGGNNVGLRYALSSDNFEYVWLLNNDTVVDDMSLAMLTEQAARYKKENSCIGIIGTKLYLYDTPNMLQCIGGKLNKYTCRTELIGSCLPDILEEGIEGNIDYVVGASMLVSKNYLKEIGLMCEDYFLYYEELDWIYRGMSHGWSLGYSKNAIVYHKEGASIGTSSDPKLKSDISDYYLLRSRIIFAEKFFPDRLWLVKICFIAVLINRLRRGQGKRFKNTLNILFDKQQNSFNGLRIIR